jgi:hypothetical protein
MTTIRIRRKLESETLHLPELKPLIGKNVEIIVLEAPTPAIAPGTGDWDAAAKAVEALEDYDYDALREQRHHDLKPADDPACFSELSAAKPISDKETQELRRLLTAEQFEALIDVAGRGGPDVEAIARMRAKSMT